MIRVLMIEDDPELAEMLTEYLERYRIRVTNYQTPHLGLSGLRTDKYDLVILDLSLPDMDGLDVCRIITSDHKVPLIISSARSDISDKVACLQMGADDYLPKPYDPRELAVRITSVLRRYGREEEKKDEAPPSPFLLDENAMIVRKEGEVLNLTRAEYGILAHFLKNRGRAISREEMLNRVDAISDESTYKSIDVIVGRLRQKVEEDPKNPAFIHSVRGVGYRFDG